VQLVVIWVQEAIALSFFFFTLLWIGLERPFLLLLSLQQHTSQFGLKINMWKLVQIMKKKYCFFLRTASIL